jgi:hypothetical protein
MAHGNGWSKGESHDPVGDTVTAFDRRRIRGAARKVARQIARAGDALEAAQTDLWNGFLDIDPDLAADRRDKAPGGGSAADRARAGGHGAAQRPAGDRHKV